MLDNKELFCNFFCLLLMFGLFFPSDAHYAAVRSDLESDAQDLEVESWSLAVDQQFVKKHPKEVVKRQDVIYGECDKSYCFNTFLSCPA